jgi:hypothetical protein
MADTPSTRLDSWKEIAAYLGRDIRTVLRWEKEKGLPVHRVPGGKRHAVFAYREEIDTWLAGQPPNHVSPEALRPGSLALFSKPLVWVVLFVLLVTGILLIRYANRPGDAQLVRVSGDTVFVLDANERLLWSHSYPEPLVEYDRSLLKRWVRLADLDGDGSKELLLIATTRQAGSPDNWRYALDFFSARGRLLWRYVPDQALSFAGRRFESPWYMTLLDVTSSPRGPDIWLVTAHNVWWPSLLMKLDAKGHASVSFVNSGHISVLSELRTERARFLLAAGVNNEFNAGMLAVLDVTKLPATSPQTPGSAHFCDLCPPGLPVRYFVFPRSELNLVEAAPYNAVWGMQNFNSKFEVATIEVPQAGLPVPASTYRGRYRFSENFELLESFRADAYWDLHRRLEREGKIKHTVDQCPERTRPIPIRMWSPEKGWQDILPQQATKK